MPRCALLFGDIRFRQCRREVLSRADLLMVRHQAGDGRSVLQQHEGDVLVMNAVHTVGEIARGFRHADNLFSHGIRLSDYQTASTWDGPSAVVGRRRGRDGDVEQNPPLPYGVSTPYLTIMPPATTSGQLELHRYPVLASLCWFRHDDAIPEKEAYFLYAENWAAVDQTAMPDHERERVIALNARYGNLLRIYTPSPPSN